MGESSPLIKSLRDICKRYPRQEKVLIAPDHQTGRQILETLARFETPWVNIHTATVSSLAGDIAEDAIISGELKELSTPAITTIIDHIFTTSADSGNLKYFRKRTVNSGIVSALSSTITEIRRAGVSPGDVAQKNSVNGAKAADIELILLEYESYLKANRCIDGAGLLKLALDRLKGQTPDEGRKYIVISRCYMGALERKLILKLCGGAPLVLGEGKIPGLAPPADLWRTEEEKPQPECKTDIERLAYVFDNSHAPQCLEDGTVKMFRAMGVRNEVREVFRRMIGANVPVDDAEIVCTDTETYLMEIHPLCEKLGIPVTFAGGTPWHLRRPGRAIAAFLLWIENDFSDAYLRRALAAGEIRIPDDGGGRTRNLAQALMTSKVGWGRERYVPAIQMEIERQSADHEKKVGDLKLLQKLCADLLQLVPAIDDEGSTNFRELCVGCARFAKEFAQTKGDEMDAAFAGQAETQFRLMSELAGENAPIAECVETLMAIITGMRTGASNPKPGHIYVSHYRHGGRSGRRNTFVVGLDETRFPGRGWQDPILLDEEREKISGDLNWSDDRIKKNIYDMTCLLSGLRGNVTVSYSSYDIHEERTVFPSSLLLQIMRVARGAPEANYDELFTFLGEPVAYSAGEADGAELDETDWWLLKLANAGVLKDAISPVTGIYPGIREGRTAATEREGSVFTEYDGKVCPDGNELDPRQNREMVVSSTTLEDAAKCPYSYFLKHVLGIKKPEELARDNSRWLDPMQRGTLLHKVFEKFAKEMMDRKAMPPRKEQVEIIKRILDEEMKKVRQEIPSPSERIFTNESTQMQRDVEVFIAMNEKLGTKPVHLEMAFGRKGSQPVEISLGEGKKILLSGKIDRVDAAGGHEYHVWDYKTGGTHGFDEDQYVNGGEQLQHGLYAAAAEVVLKTTGEDPDARVTNTGYLMPTEKGTKDGKGGKFERDPWRKSEWQGALTKLLDMIAAGTFFMSDEAQCDYCDYAEICGNEARQKQSKAKRKNEEDKALCAWRELKDYE